MFKKIIIALFFISSIAQGQTFVKGTMEPADEMYSWVILYQLKGSQQYYIKNTTISNGEFSIDIPEETSTGMYRLMYDMDNGGYVDFIYNNRNIELKFDPTYPSGTVEFLNSEENNAYKNYLSEISVSQSKLDSLQSVYFHSNEKEIIAKNYENEVKNNLELQQKYEQLTDGELASHFIAANKKYNASKILETPQEYFNSVKEHYFDAINFKDEALKNSIFITKKVINYIFYLNGSDDVEVQKALYKKSVNEVIEKIGDDDALKSEILITLLYTFAQIENTTLIDYIVENHYNNLPTEVKKDHLLDEINNMVKLAVGKTAPEITWEEKGKTKKLSELNIAKKYIIAFWSTSCSHCLKEIPKLYEFTKDMKDVHVLAYALELDELGFNHYTLNFVNWTNILGLEKWENETARTYEITATPTYFVLDENKTIIAKPEFFKDIKAFFKED